MFKKVFIGSDHAGIEVRDKIISFLHSKNLEVQKFEMREDYTDIAKAVSTSVIQNQFSCGILICGSGVGVSIVANRFKGIRASLSHSVEVAKLSRNHNNANVLCLGARMVQAEEQLKIVNEFLQSNFEGGRHEKRINNID